MYCLAQSYLFDIVEMHGPKGVCEKAIDNCY